MKELHSILFPDPEQSPRLVAAVNSPAHDGMSMVGVYPVTSLATGLPCLPITAM
jgi:hypothetical protein